MRVHTYSIQLAAYSDRTWSVAVVRRDFERGREVDAELVTLTHADERQLRWVLRQETERALTLAEKERTAKGGGPVVV